MKYCDECNSLMAPKKDGDEKYLICRSCGHKEKIGDEDFKVSKKHKKDPKDQVVVVDEENREENNLPVTERKCPECGHNKAAWWTQQTRASDEPATRFYKCKKCGHKWREYS
ncbi:MAG: transcription factor S [Candidatus Aenigmatarchaeota archaeon]